MRLKAQIGSLLIALGFASTAITSAVAAPSGGQASQANGSISSSSWAAESEECVFLGLINSYRQQNGLGTLAFSPTLGAAADHHSSDMAANSYFSHTLSDGTTWSKNIANHGYPSDTSRAENIAAGRASASEVFLQWKNSAGHNANMLGSNFKAIGIGRAQLDGSTYTSYWTNTFGSRVDQTYTCSGQTTVVADTSGSLLKIVSSGRTSSSTASTLAYDGKTSSSWYTTKSTPPSNSYVYFDLGSAKSISLIKWYFSKSGSADSYKIQVSDDKSTWTTVTTKSGPKSGVWQSLKLAKTARYVRFYFANPNRDRVLGYLAEVKIYS